MLRLSRRSVLASPLALAACREVEAAYFGRTDAPRTEQLIYLIGAEPATIDPAKSADR